MEISQQIFIWGSFIIVAITVLIFCSVLLRRYVEIVVTFRPPKIEFRIGNPHTTKKSRIDYRD